MLLLLEEVVDLGGSLKQVYILPGAIYLQKIPSVPVCCTAYCTVQMLKGLVEYHSISRDKGMWCSAMYVKGAGAPSPRKGLLLIKGRQLN